MEQGQKHRRKLWSLLGLALVVVLAVLFQPVFSSSVPDVPQAGTSAEQQPAGVLNEAEVLTSEQELSSSVDTDSSPELSKVAQVPSSNNCITCHTDETLLQQIAEEPEEVESELAEGEG